MTLDEFADLFDKPRKRGNSYSVCCPVHDDSNPSAQLTEKDGKILGHCFSCLANGLDMAAALGVNPSLLFSESLEKDDHWMLKKTQENDDTIILLHDSDQKQGRRIRYQDHQLYRQCMARRSRRRQLGLHQVIIEV